MFVKISDLPIEITIGKGPDEIIIPLKLHP